MLRVIFFVFFFAALAFAHPPFRAQPPLRCHFYLEEGCPQVEGIVFRAMQEILEDYPTATAELLRLHFHDCFIGGCDASVMLAASNNNRTVERDAVPNKTLKGFHLIKIVKDKVEISCPGVISCSDILALATRDAIVMAGGPYYIVSTGRRDSREPFFDKAMAEIPQPDGNISETLRLFMSRGFNERETVALLGGGHSIGKIGCEFIRPRLSNFMGTGLPDPTIPSYFFEVLKKKCPPENNSTHSIALNKHRGTNESAVSMSGIRASFDNHYYKTLMRGRGILFADQQLMANKRTAAVVAEYAKEDGSYKFWIDFAAAMKKLSEFGVLTGSDGEIRRHCSYVNNI